VDDTVLVGVVAPNRPVDQMTNALSLDQRRVDLFEHERQAATRGADGHFGPTFE
jgi:hypothetical protein